MNVFVGCELIEESNKIETLFLSDNDVKITFDTFAPYFHPMGKIWK